jgi:hypothetical protein
LKITENLSAYFLTGFNQALGYKHKNKSLEETLRTTLKADAKLIGFDEEPIVVETCSSPIADEFSKLSIKEVKPEVKLKSSSETGDCCSSLNGSAAEAKADYNLKNASRREMFAVVGRGDLDVVSISTANHEGMLCSCTFVFYMKQALYMYYLIIVNRLL